MIYLDVGDCVKEDFKQLDKNQLCPCGSGKTYGECCVMKRFDFGLNGNKLVQRKPIDENMFDEINEIKYIFRELYGRFPMKKEKVATFGDLNNNQSLNEIVYALRRAKIPENKIYATYRMDGLIPNELNIDLIPDILLEEFSDYVHEYDELINDTFDDGHINILKYVKFVNDIGFHTLHDANYKLVLCLNDFMSRHSKSDSRIEYRKGSLMEYLMFIVLKTKKTLEGIKVLITNNMNEDIYTIGRSLFESYMYLNAINQDKDFFNNYILPIIDTDKYQPLIDNNKLSKEKYVNKKTGNIVNTYLKTFSLSKYFIYEEDKKIYNLFYTSSSQFVHSDIKSADEYFKEFDIYTEFDPNLKAGLITISLGCLILRQITLIEEVQSQYKKDVRYLLDNIETDLIKCFEMFNTDKEQHDEIFNVYISRLKNN